MAGDTLAVAPRQPDLPMADSEVMALVNILHADLLNGDEATATHLIDMLAAGTYRRLLLLTHGDKAGVVMADGHLSTSQLTSFSRIGELDLIVLNTCESLDVAMAMHNELPVTDLICTVRALPDPTALYLTKQLALQLSRGLSNQDAYERSKPGQNRDYLFIPRSDRTGKYTVTPAERPDSMAEDIVKIRDEVHRIVALVDGDERWNQPGMIHVLNDLMERNEKLEANVIFLRWMVVGLTILTFVILVLHLVPLWAGG